MAGDYSERARCALAAFGLTIHDDAPGAPPMDDHARQLDERLAQGQCALIVGPSGAGKSTLLRALARRTGAIDGGALVARPARGARAECARAQSARVVDLFDGPIDRTLRLLAAAGLADARVFARRVHELSDGQRARLGIALAMSRAGATIVLDEFCSGLDSATSRSLCCTLRRWLERTPATRLICATAREDVEHWLAPAVIARVEWGGEVHIEDGAARAESDPPVIEPGTFDDYAALAPLHYRAGRPATIRRILRARDGAARDDEGCNTIGVLVTSMPTLNGSWRARAFGGRYAHGSMRTRAALLNREVRCISRIIVDPRWRGRGVGSALVRAYLCDPETIATEAVAAMGAACPLFTRAGMTEWPLAPALRDRRLLLALARAGVDVADLGDVAHIMRNATVSRALGIWANGAGATRRLARDIEAISRAALCSLVGRGRAYTWSQSASARRETGAS